MNDATTAARTGLWDAFKAGRRAGKSQFSAVGAVATVAAGTRVTFYASDLARAEKDIVAASKRLGVYVKIERDDENKCLRVSP